MRQKWAIGLTGGIACGKSEVAGILMAEGVPVYDTDTAAHSLLVPGHWVYEKTVQEFGLDIVNAEGIIDRRKLGARVFSDKASRDRLNGIMHPEIFRLMNEWLREQLATHDQAVAMVPLLYETGAETWFDRVIAVAAKESLVMSRLNARGLTRDEAKARIASQMPLEEKVRRADVVIWNNEDLHALRSATLKAWKDLIN